MVIEYLCVIIDLVPELEGAIDESEEIKFSYEKDLKNSLISQASELFPEYKIYGSGNEGIEYLIEGKRIDLLLEKSDGSLLVIESKIFNDII